MYFKLPGDVSPIIPKQYRDELCTIQFDTFTPEVNLMKRGTPGTDGHSIVKLVTKEFGPNQVSTALKRFL